MFEINDKVVYGVVGVCEIENIGKPPIKGIDKDYYFLQPVYDSKGIIYSPVDSTKVMIRGILIRMLVRNLLKGQSTVGKMKNLMKRFIQ